FKIITPYDPQRTLIENKLKMTNGELPWEDTVFNVDAFQGNEEDYIIISVVRTRGLGFLSSLRRVNVMLTRCKRGMFICSNRAFLESKGAECLVGEMAKEFAEQAWVSIESIVAGNL
ncbi:AAA domain-containing protein, partial [Vararia minispora EC-137]